MTQPAFPDGHFYSPVVDASEAARDAGRIWPASTKPVRGVDLNHAGHERLLREVFPSLLEGYDYPTAGPADEVLERFYDFNGQFERQDPRVAFCLLQMIRPRRIVEVGSGYSTLLMADVNRRLLGGSAAITCIEPFPRPFLRRAGAAGDIELIEERVQSVDESIFATLADGDVLFVDSSHVSKTGSDVNRLILDILPILAPGCTFTSTIFSCRWIIRSAGSASLVFRGTNSMCCRRSWHSTRSTASFTEVRSPAKRTPRHWPPFSRAHPPTVEAYGSSERFRRHRREANRALGSGTCWSNGSNCQK